MIKSSPPMSELTRTRCCRPAEMRASVRRVLRSAWPPALVFAVLVLAWDLIANAVHASLSLPGPWYVVTGSWRDRGDLAAAIWVTTEEALLGIGLAVLCAVILALAVDWSRRCAAASTR